MRKIEVRRLLTIAVAATLGFPAPAALAATGAPSAARASTSPILITFDNDSPGAKPNGFSSVDSPLVRFSDTVGADLQLLNFGGQSNGQALAANSDFDNSGLEIRLARPTNFVQLVFGNDDPNFSSPGDRAVLTVFRGGTQVGQSSVVMNRNDRADQKITFVAKSIFDRAVIEYRVSHPGGLIEIIDDVRVNPLCSVFGTEGNDTLVGTANNDVICGGGGNDSISGGGGADLIYAGPGNDTVTGGTGNDTAFGGDGNDIVIGSGGNDVLSGDAGNDRLDGGPGTDRCDGGTGTDTAKACEVRQRIP